MKLTGRIKPVSYFQANAMEIVKDIAETRNPMILTVNGEGRVIVQDIRSYEEAQEKLDFMRIMMTGDQAVREGKTYPTKEAFARIHSRIEARQRKSKPRSS